MNKTLKGKRFEISISDDCFPSALKDIQYPPKKLYCIGNVGALTEGIAIVGARKATAYGISCAKRFGKRSSELGINVISGGAKGCDSAAHKGALEAYGRCVVFLGGGCDRIYPVSNFSLFQEIIDNDGIIVSEQSWNFDPLPYTFRLRNRLIAGMSKATLIVEAGLPSGTFSTADEALRANRDVLVVPGAITSKYSKGANMLLYQGARPIIDLQSFDDVLCELFDVAISNCSNNKCADTNHNTCVISTKLQEYIFVSICAQPMSMDQIFESLRNTPFKSAEIRDVVSAVSSLEVASLITLNNDGNYIRQL